MGKVCPNYGGGDLDYKTEKKSIRFSQKELTVIEKKAEKAKLKLSEYVRQSALDKNIVVIEDLKEFTKELRAIGKNLNQLAILAHQGKINCVNLENTQKKVDGIWQLLNSLMVEMKK